MSLLSQASVHAWIQENGIKTENGQPLDFHTHRYLFAVYSDRSPFLCCTKAGQIGFSTMAIIKSIWAAKNIGLDIGYVLPTADMVEKFVGSKVNRLAQQNKVIGDMMKDKDSITQKQIGEHYIHYLGAMTSRSAIMLSLDLLVLDEYDKAPQEILEKYDSRLQHSRFGYKWVFSNPTRPDFGVDIFWKKSDQKKWHITHSCGKTYVMDESCVDYVEEKYHCPFCKEEITDEERRLGEWKPTAKGDWSGYWIPLWINPMIKARTICDYKRSKTPEYFYNFVAGLPYVNENDQVSLETLQKSLYPQPNDQKDRPIIGLDTGLDLHLVVGNKTGIFYYERVPKISETDEVDYDPYNRIDALMIKLPEAILVADQGGDLTPIRRLQKKYPNRVYLCYFSRETRNMDLIRWGENENDGAVYVDRNRMVQFVVDCFKEQTMTLNGTVQDWLAFFEHALNIYRVREIKEGQENEPVYNWRYVWKRKGADHWFLALVYCMVGLDRYAQNSVFFVKKDRNILGFERTVAIENGKISSVQLMKHSRNRDLPLTDF